MLSSARASRAQNRLLVLVDRSGSMSGKKIEQVRGALKFVLGNLREGDTFNIIAYDSQVDVRITALTTLLEPVMIVTMGGVVAFVVFSILLPILQMNTVVR